jgi:hypothetical protein
MDVAAGRSEGSVSAIDRVVLPVGVPKPQSLGAVVDDLDQRLREGRTEDYVPIPTGFHPLDEYLEGGLHADDLWLWGGIQNIGKTVAAVQMARNIATSGAALPVVVCYEHSPLFILHRLLCLESIDPTRERVSGGLTSGALNAAVVHALRRGQELSVQGLLSEMPEVEAAWGKIESYLDSMWLVLGDGRKTTVDVLELYVKLAQLPGHGLHHRFFDHLVDGCQELSVVTIDDVPQSPCFHLPRTPR